MACKPNYYDAPGPGAPSSPEALLPGRRRVATVCTCTASSGHYQQSLNATGCTLTAPLPAPGTQRPARAALLTTSGKSEGRGTGPLPALGEKESTTASAARDAAPGGPNPSARVPMQHADLHARAHPLKRPRFESTTDSCVCISSKSPAGRRGSRLVAPVGCVGTNPRLSLVRRQPGRARPDAACCFVHWVCGPSSGPNRQRRCLWRE